MKKEIKTAVIYARYSSDNQSEQSIDGQLRVCNEYAKNNDIIILDTYIDRAMTGTNDNRPDFQRMIKDSSRKEWDYVLVYKFDRFSRNKLETAIHKNTLKTNGVKLLSATEYIPDSPEAIILESMLEGYAEYYSAELSQKVKRGLNESRIKGNYTGGHLLYGYRKENQKLVIDEEKAEHVRFIYEQYAQDVYVKDIIDNLTARGVLNKGKRFAINTIHKILSNEKYTGIYNFNGKIYDNIYPQIVPTELFEKVRAKSIKNKKGSRSPEHFYLLRDKLKCGYCGMPITAESGTTKLGNVIRYYRCSGKRKHNGCQKEQERKEMLEQYVIENVTNYLSDDNNLRFMARKITEMQDIRLKENVVLTKLIKEKRQTENSINNIMSAIENGGTSATAMKRLRELETLLKKIETQLVVEQSKTEIKLTEDEIIAFYKLALKQEPKTIISLLVKEILVFNDKMIITYNTPKTLSPDESRDFSFYNKNVKMPVKLMNKPIPILKDYTLMMKIYI